MLTYVKTEMLIGLGLSVVMGLSQAAQGDVFSVRSDKAAYVSTYDKDTNLGGGAILSICGVDNRMGLVQWNLSAIPASATVTSATITFFGGTGYPNPGGGNLQVYQIIAAWAEDTVTWNNRPAISAEVGTIPYTDGPTLVMSLNSVNLTTLTQGWVNGTTSNYGVFVNQTNSGVISISSDDNPEVAQRPLLEVTYVVPEPATLAMLGSGLIFCLAARRRR